jgi:hypothetical protein
MRAFPLSFALFIHIKYRDTPIRKYNAIQTGANIQPGGEKLGFVRVGYQVVTEEEVNTDPITPASWQTANEITNLILLFMTIIFIFMIIFLLFLQV